MFIINRKEICFYFDFGPVVAGGTTTVVSVVPVPFFDFMTIATIRCSSIRNARTILGN
jgi:uncharacterized protein (DUF697 family)